MDSDACKGPKTILGLRQWLRSKDAKEEHERQILRSWTLNRPLQTCKHPADGYFPRSIREDWTSVAHLFEDIAQVHSQHPSSDGSSRLLIRLSDSQLVETVLLPREGVCVSSQLGCAVACAFCMTGRGGLKRQLGSAEIVAQVILARKIQPVRKVVFMGMGEPSHNLQQVLEAIDFLGTEAEFAHKQLVLSTVGDRRVFERLPLGRVKPALALSLHTTQPLLREKLLPNAPKITPAELVDLAEEYARRTTYPIQYQWTLIQGLNDGEEEWEEIVRLLKGKRAILNLIPYNSVDGLYFQRPSWENAAKMARTLHQRGILTKLRRSAAQDVHGGCGQLRARTLASIA